MRRRSCSSTIRAWRGARTRQILEAAGYEVVEAEDGMAALERYFLEKPDVVLLDLVMKGMTGSTCSTSCASSIRSVRAIVVVGRHPGLVARDGRGRRGARLPEQAGRSGEPAERGIGRARGAGVMELTAVQQDALVELLNIGFGRAAASLSQLTGHRVLLEVPQVTLHRSTESATRSSASIQERRRQRAPDLHRPGRRRRAADPRSERAPRF